MVNFLLPGKIKTCSPLSPFQTTRLPEWEKLSVTSTSVLKGNIDQYSDLLISMNGQWILKFQCWRILSRLKLNLKHLLLHLSKRLRVKIQSSENESSQARVHFKDQLCGWISLRWQVDFCLMKLHFPWAE